MQQVGSSPLTRDQTRAPCLGSHWTTREVPSAWYSSENKRILRAQEVQDPEHDSPFLNWHLRQDFSGPLLKIRDLGIHTIFLLYHRILTLAYSGAYTFLELPRWHSGKEPAYNAGDSGLIPGARRSLAEGNANTFQNSCLENPKTEEPGRLQSMGLQRARHDLATNQQYTVSHGLFSAV